MNRHDQDDPAIAPTQSGQGGATATVGGHQCAPHPWSLDLNDLGATALSPRGTFDAGSFQEFTLVYTAGVYGIDDSGAVRLCFRYATDQSPLQFDRPKDPGYTTVEASNGAVLECRYSNKGNVRPWDKCLEVRVVRGYLKEHDTLTFRIGDRRGGSPGIRLQTFAEDSFEFRVLVDPIAAYNFQSLPEQPHVAIRGGAPHRLIAVAPTQVVAGDPFTLRIKAEDIWGNPTDLADMLLKIAAEGPPLALPDNLRLEPGRFVTEISGLVSSTPGDILISLLRDGEVAARVNPVRITAKADLRPFWGDLHGQSEETIGTNSARDYFAFARDLAFLDVTAHQGNDFQMSDAFWDELNALAREFDVPGQFVVLPGYEWSGNTALGGDRNVFFRTEGRPIRRSSHALVPAPQSPHHVVRTANLLFAALAEANEDAICFAHCGGRYADIKMSHDGRFETAVEVHSSWGTFEWLLHDAFEAGHRVGIVANSDGHKGRPGASYPGSSLFGAVGGLTCLLMPHLDRDSVFDALRKRRHYATTGGPSGRLVLDVSARFEAGCDLYESDPALGQSAKQKATHARMGDIVDTRDAKVEVLVDASAAVPLERIEIFNGTDIVATWRPQGADLEANRIRILWEGAEYRGRARQVVWDGFAELEGNTIVRAEPINFLNPDRRLEQTSITRVAWNSLTTGNFCGVDLWLWSPDAGTLRIESPLVSASLDIARIGADETVFDRSGVLPRLMRVFRLPDRLEKKSASCKFAVGLGEGADNPIYARITLEDGTRAWSSPIYVRRN